MSDHILSKSWKTLLLIQLAIVFVSTSTFSIGLHSLSAAATLAKQRASTVQNPSLPLPPQPDPIKGEKGDAAEIDYKKLDAIVQQRIAQLPLPKPEHGVNGKDGADGINGQDGVDGKDGANGQDGVTGREIELQTNPLSGNLEWRYIGDDSWQLLMKKCTITDTCGAQ